MCFSSLCTNKSLSLQKLLWGTLALQGKVLTCTFVWRNWVSHQGNNSWWLLPNPACPKVQQKETGAPGMGLVKSVLKMGGGGIQHCYFQRFLCFYCVCIGVSVPGCACRGQRTTWHSCPSFSVDMGVSPRLGSEYPCPKCHSLPLYLYFKIFSVIIIIIIKHVCIHMCHRGHGGVRRQLCGISSRLTLLHGFWGSHSGGHWVARAVTSEPSCQPLFNKTKLGLHAFNSST